MLYMYTCIYIYIYIYRERERLKKTREGGEQRPLERERARSTPPAG